MTSISRRDFARLVALSGTATLLPTRAFADQETLESLGYSVYVFDYQFGFNPTSAAATDAWRAG